MNPSKRMMRSLIRVSEVDIANGFVYVIIPGWDTEIKIKLEMNKLPTEVNELLLPGKRFHAKVNIGAESQEDLIFDDWELE